MYDRWTSESPLAYPKRVEAWTPRQQVYGSTYRNADEAHNYYGVEDEEYGLSSSRQRRTPEWTPPARTTSPLARYDSPRRLTYDEIRVQMSAPRLSRELMITDPCSMFVPPQRLEDREKPVVVLDLDETLVYSRDGTVRRRPGLDHLFRTLKNRCEVIIWTAGEKEYAVNVIRQIDMERCVQHCVYRHPKWWTGRPGYSKGLRALGRPLHRTILVDNTPDCLKEDPSNSILVTDFHGYDHEDRTLYLLADVAEQLISNPRAHVATVLRHNRHISMRQIPCDADETSIEVFTFSRDAHPTTVKKNFDLIPSSPRRW